MSTEIMADAQANLNKNKAAQKNNISMFELVQEQCGIAEKVQAGVLKIEQQLEEFNQLMEEKKREYEACMAPIVKNGPAGQLIKLNQNRNKR